MPFSELLSVCSFLIKLAATDSRYSIEASTDAGERVSALICLFLVFRINLVHFTVFYSAAFYPRDRIEAMKGHSRLQ